MNPTLRFVSTCLVTLLVAVSSAQAAASDGFASGSDGFLHSVLASIVFGLVGIVLAIVGFKLFDFVTPFNLEKEMCENRNVAVGILCGAIVLGVCHIIAASMS